MEGWISTACPAPAKHGTASVIPDAQAAAGPGNAPAHSYAAKARAHNAAVMLHCCQPTCTWPASASCPLQAEQRILARAENKEYLPIEGLEAFRKATVELLLGAGHPAIAEVGPQGAAWPVCVVCGGIMMYTAAGMHARRRLLLLLQAHGPCCCAVGSAVVSWPG